MKKIIIVKYSFCKTFGVNNELNTIITYPKSNEVVGWQRQWVSNLESQSSVQILIKTSTTKTSMWSWCMSMVSVCI
jgi:hypothetical protein